MGVESQAGKAMGLAEVRVVGRRGLEGQPGGADSSGPPLELGQGMRRGGESHGPPLLFPERDSQD